MLLYTVVQPNLGCTFCEPPVLPEEVRDIALLAASGAHVAAHQLDRSHVARRGRWLCNAAWATHAELSVAQQSAVESGSNALCTVCNCRSTRQGPAWMRRRHTWIPWRLRRRGPQTGQRTLRRKPGKPGKKSCRISSCWCQQHSSTPRLLTSLQGWQGLCRVHGQGNKSIACGSFGFEQVGTPLVSLPAARISINVLRSPDLAPPPELAIALRLRLDQKTMV